MWIPRTELHLCFLEQSINTVFEEPGRASLDRIEAYADEANFISSKRERIFPRNFFLISEFVSQTYNLDLRKQFAKNLFVETGK